MTMTLICILLSTLLGVGGQILLKQGMSKMGEQSLAVGGLADIGLRIMTSPWVILGLMVYASGTFFWLIALSRVELSFAYPFASLSYVFILASAWALLGETVSILRLAGVVTICLGVLIVSQS
ncbi:MAG TPA: EamA family transporter [Thermomicrobiales bacterium]|nr:EamA family transporter [Thermomicrobiales bacterium]